MNITTPTVKKCPKCGSTNIEFDKRWVLVWDECKDCEHKFHERFGR